jgi:hypothetical protein
MRPIVLATSLSIAKTSVSFPVERVGPKMGVSGDPIES